MQRAAAALCLLLLAGCQTLSNAYDSWFGTPQPAIQPAALTSFQPAASLTVAWRGTVGETEKGQFFPALADGVVYATGANGQIGAFDAASGAPTGQIDAGHALSGGVGAGSGLVLVGTSQGDVFAYKPDGKLAWKAQVAGEVLARPVVDSGVVVVRTGNGHIIGLDSLTGARKWLYQRTLPALSVRSHAGVVVYRGGIFAGFAGGRLVALSLDKGRVGWESVVALPRGTTELERVADVTSLPVVNDRQACAVAFQGRVACFDIQRGTTLWARDVSSYAGMGADEANLYITDDHGAVVARDRKTGASVWKQDKLYGRKVTAPLAIGKYVVVGDFEGYVHLISRENGAFAARLQTDGSAIMAPPLALDASRFVVQTRKGGVFAVTIQ